MIIVRKYKVWFAESNFFLWYSIIQGVPLIIVLYVRWDDIKEKGLANII
jgi:hypothetical protein